MSEALEQLRQYCETGQLEAAFGLLDAMDEMSRDDKLHKNQSEMPGNALGRDAWCRDTMT